VKFHPRQAVPLSTDIDYELRQYDECSSKARVLFEMGFRHEASILENLAELCYEKATMFTLFDQLRKPLEGSDQTEHRETDSST
jgi:hypothetical protein